MNIKHLSYYILFFIILTANIFGSSNNLGAALPLYSILPFMGILLSIAILPLVNPIFWHHNYGKVSMFWAMLFLLPFASQQGAGIALYYLLHVVLLEYLPFIILLFTLFTISGGIYIKGKFSGSPKFNVFIRQLRSFKFELK